MISYELAKKLKEAGFPKGGKRYVFDGIKNIEVDMPIIPTLSELIEACGDCLSHIKRMPHDRSWFAVSHCGHENHEPGGNNIECSASTHEEAVANLWLELNKKR